MNESPDVPAGFGSASANRWRSSLIALFLVIFVTLVLYRETAWSMVSIWARSDTFAHGFLILPISLWLIWRDRRSFVGLMPCASFWPLPFMAAAGFMWLLSEMAVVNVVSQFALVFALVLAVPAILGTRVAQKMIFPLGFLFFAVPFGEFTMPLLMDWTAKMTILGLRWSGVPVYQEGLRFIIPTGNWSVVEACSGVRYLIASLVVGTLFAYLNYHSLKRRLIFVGMSFVVPVIANWMRAYMIVMLGHLSGNKLATGVDHLIYGWLFFGVVIMVLFWIGARWREDVPPKDAAGSQNDALSVAYAGRNRLMPVVLATLALTSSGPLAEWGFEHDGASPHIAAIPRVEPVAGWDNSPSSFVDLTPHFENASASANSAFVKNGQKVGLYIAYYRNQGSDRRMISSTNVLVSSRDSRWIRIAGSPLQSSVGGEPLTVQATELRGTDSSRLMVWQWYWINGRLTGSERMAKAYTALYRLLGQGDDSAAIFAFTPAESAEAAERLLQDFVESQGGAISQALQKARKGGE